MTRAPRARASCTATAPTPPAPPSTKIVSPGLTPSRRRPRSLVSPATPAAEATAQSIDGGLRTHASRTAYSAWGFRPRPNTSPPPHTPPPPTPPAALVHHAAGVEAETTRPDQRRAAVHRPGHGLPVGRVHAGRAHSDPDLARARVRVGSIVPSQDLGAPVGREL